MFKRSITIGCLAVILSAPFFVALAQSETDAIRYASTELNGSSRFQSMAGAFGSVGVDYSSIQQNPAGIGLNRKYMSLSATIDYNNAVEEAMWYNRGFRNSKSKFALSELSFSGAMPLSNDVGFSYGFGARRVADFRRNMSIHTDRAQQSLADYTAAILNNTQYRNNSLISHSNLNTATGAAWQDRSLPWLGIMGFEGGWIDSNKPSGGLYYPRYVYGGAIERPTSVEMKLQESGNITAYDAAFGFNIKDIVYLGMSVNMSSITYSAISNYTEWYLMDKADGKRDNLGLDGETSTSGFGAGVGFGAIVEPVQGLRFGLAYFTPTWYMMNRIVQARASSVYGGDRIFVNKEGQEIKELSVETPIARAEYTYHNPGRLVVSGSYIFGQLGLLSVDYEYRNMGSNRLADVSAQGEANSYTPDNKAIQEDFGGEHTVRIGAEIRATNRLSIRGGYLMRSAFIKNALLNDFSGSAKQEVLVAGITPHYILPGSNWAITSGLGFRFTPTVYGDLAVVWSRSYAHLYTFPFINDEGSKLAPGSEGKPVEPRLTQDAVSLKKDNLRVSFTLGMRF